MSHEQNDRTVSLLKSRSVIRFALHATLLLAFSGVASSAFAASSKSSKQCEVLFDSVSDNGSDKIPTGKMTTTEAGRSTGRQSIGSTETIASIYTGSQLFSVVLGDGRGNLEGSAGLYKRDGREWKILIPGELKVDSQGAPLVEQLSLAKNDKNAYVVTVIDGNIHLLTSHSDMRAPGSFIQFGTKESPLYEAGSLQKRYLPLNERESQVAIFQDPTLSSAGAQLVMVSLKFKTPQAVGDGITFAFELLPSDKSSDIRLNGKPVVLDYEFHDAVHMSTMRTGNREKILFSKILFEHFRETELGFFGSHIEIVREWLVNIANRVLGSVSPELFLEEADERVAYNISTGKIEKDVSFENEIFNENNAEFIQRYFVSRGQAELKISADGEEFRLDGKIDLLEGRKPAAWGGHNGKDVIFSKDGVLYALVNKDPRTDSMGLVEIGKLDSLFRGIFTGGSLPQELKFHSYMTSTREAIEHGFIVMTGKAANGQEFTGAVRMDLLLGKSLQMKDSYLLMDRQLTEIELEARLVVENEQPPIFDAITPIQTSLAAYQQEYDASNPHINLLASSTSKVVHKFKKPKSTLELSPGVTYAEFSQAENVENPSGVYVGMKPDAITGNEEMRQVGQLLARPHKPADEAHPERQFIWAQYEAASKRNHEPTESDSYSAESVDHDRVLTLYAIDAARIDGKRGYNLTVAIRDGEEKTQTIALDAGKSSWLRNTDYFRNAIFVQGRKSDRGFVYLLLSFESVVEGRAPQSTTIVYRINLGKLEATTTSELKDFVITGKNMRDLVGYDEQGLPTLNITPNLSSDAHAFAVYDLKKGAKEFPNHATGSSKRKIKFGDSANGNGYRDDAYVSSKDSWWVHGSDIVKKYPNMGRSMDLAQFDSFVALGKWLDQQSESTHPAERTILVVPESLRELVWDFIMTKGFGNQRETKPGQTNPPDTPFSSQNRKLSINVLDRERSSQEQYYANLESWSKSHLARPDERTFVLARMDDILSNAGGMPEPADPNNGFKLNYIHGAEVTDLAQVSSATTEAYPSGLYLLASEHPIPLADFRSVKTPPSAAMLVLATPAEMKTIEKSAAHEIENGLLDRFHVQEIKDPDEESMAASLAEIFQNKDVKTFDYQFSAREIKQKAELNPQQSFEVVVDFAISRFAALIGQKKESRFESFMRFRAAFAQAVLSDKEIRRTRVINKYFVERVLTQVFDIPMNLATLPVDDPMSILSRQDSLLLLQDAGYSGPFDLKAKVRDTLLSQTRADAGKAVPSSMILFGNSGSGKTFLFKSLVKMLKLKMYDFNTELNNNDAQAIIINVGKLKEKGGADRDGDMDVDQAIAHLNKLLATPMGYRSWILLDDVHAASDAVKAKILNWQRGIFESSDGMYSIQIATRGGKATIRRPVRNLNIFMTLNPTADQDQIAKYAKDKAKPTTQEILLATMSTPDFKIEPSFLLRWGQIINLDYMPAGAKGPELLKSLAKASNDLLNTMSRIALVDPKVIASLVANSSTVDARTFLSSSTSSIVEVASADRNAGSLVLVVPAMTRFSNRPGGSSIGMENDASDRIQKWVTANTRTLSLDSSLDGNLAFIKLIVDAFRTPIYESLTMALQEDPRFARGTTEQKTLLAPVLAAISDHLQAHTYVSLRDLGVNASEFGFNTPSERDVFRAALAKMSDPNEQPLYPVGFKTIDSVVSTWQDVHGYSNPPALSTRQEVISTFVGKNRDVLRRRLAQIMRVEDLDSLPDPGTWTVHLRGDSPTNPKEVGRELVGNLWDYLDRVFDSKLAESRIPGAPQLNIYSATRLYLFSIDRAMTQMKWVRPSKFLLQSLQLITEDQVLSQKPGVQSFLFTDPQRLIKPSIPDFIFQIIASSHSLEEVPQVTRDKQREDFERDVSKLISPGTP